MLTRLDFPVPAPDAAGLRGEKAPDSRRGSADPDLLEMAVLLPRWQVFALDDLARKRGMNVGQLLRRVIGNMLQQVADQGL